MTHLSPEQLVTAARSSRHRANRNGHSTPSGELRQLLAGVRSGEIFAVPFPWPKLDVLTNALFPGTITVLCGDPSAGKTFFILDCMNAWTESGVSVGAYFVEKDLKFYTRRIVAQLEAKSEYANLRWWEQHADEVEDAITRHSATIDRLGECMTLESTGDRMTLRRLTEWVRDELRNGKRIVIVDPITAVDAGADRWTADDMFVIESQKLLNRYNASMILVTHPQKANLQKRSGHNMAAGAAYYRFSDTTLWLNKLTKPKNFDVFGIHGRTSATTSLVMEIHKARESKGTGQAVAMAFGEGLHFSEHGVILGESDEAPDGQPEEPMNASDLKRMMVKLGQTFPLMINETQAATFKREIARHSYRTAESAIDDHFAKHGNKPDGLLETLRQS